MPVISTRSSEAPSRLVSCAIEFVISVSLAARCVSSAPDRLALSALTLNSIRASPAKLSIFVSLNVEYITFAPCAFDERISA